MEGCLWAFTLWQETHSFLFLVPLRSYNSSIPFLYKYSHIILVIPTPSSTHSHPDSPHSHPNSSHSYPYSPHSHHDSPHSHPHSSHSHSDSPHSHHSLHSIPWFPIPGFKDSQYNVLKQGQIWLYVVLSCIVLKFERVRIRQQFLLSVLSSFLWIGSISAFHGNRRNRPRQQYIKIVM